MMIRVIKVEIVVADANCKAGVTILGFTVTKKSPRAAEAVARFVAFFRLAGLEQPGRRHLVGVELSG